MLAGVGTAGHEGETQVGDTRSPLGHSWALSETGATFSLIFSRGKSGLKTPQWLGRLQTNAKRGGRDKTQKKNTR